MSVEVPKLRFAGLAREAHKDDILQVIQLGHLAARAACAEATSRLQFQQSSFCVKLHGIFRK